MWPKLYHDSGTPIPLSESSQYETETHITCGATEDSVTATVKEMFTCPVCYNLLSDGKSCPQSDCDASICGQCYKSILNSTQSNKACPNCRKPNIANFKDTGRFFKRLMSELVLSCPNKHRYENYDNTCEVRLKFEHMKQHV